MVRPYHVERTGWQLTWTVDVARDWHGGGTRDNPSWAVINSPYRHRYSLTLPSTSILVSTVEGGGEWILVQAVAPLDQTGESCRQFNINGIDTRAADAGVRLDQLVELEVEIQREDRAMLENIYPKEAPLDPRAQAHTRADRFSVMYRKLYRELIDAAGACRPPSDEDERAASRSSRRPDPEGALRG